MTAPLVLRAANLAAVPGVAHGFSTRVRSADRIDFDLRARPEAPEHCAADRGAFLAACGLSGAALVTLGQTHEDRIFEVEGGEPLPSVPPAGFDAVVVSGAGVAVAVGTADCLPILIADRRGAVVAAVHAGWRSSALGLPARVVRLLTESYGVDPSELSVAMGPAIGPCCFEVGEEVVDALESRIGEPASWTLRQEGRKPHVDLAHANSRALAAAGVRIDAIERMPGCTMCEAERFFSFRREGAATGRQLSAIGLVAAAGAGSGSARPWPSASSTSA